MYKYNNCENIYFPRIFDFTAIYDAPKKKNILKTYNIIFASTGILI